MASAPPSGLTSRRHLQSFYRLLMRAPRRRRNHALDDGMQRRDRGACGRLERPDKMVNYRRLPAG